MEKWIQKLSRKIGFTQTEINISLFLLSTFFVGLVIYYVKESKNDSSYLEMDYSAQDSLFNMAVAPLETSDSLAVSNSNKTITPKKKIQEETKKKDKETVSKKVASLPKELDINYATVSQLMSIPGIGKATAENIVNFRKQNGNFVKLGQLLSVKGIGKAKLEKLKNFIAIKK